MDLSSHCPGLGGCGDIDGMREAVVFVEGGGGICSRQKGLSLHCPKILGVAGNSDAFAKSAAAAATATTIIIRRFDDRDNFIDVLPLPPAIRRSPPPPRSRVLPFLVSRAASVVPPLATTEERWSADGPVVRRHRPRGHAARGRDRQADCRGWIQLRL